MRTRPKRDVCHLEQMSEGNGPGEIENGSRGISVVHVTIPNQPIQVQSVIQSNQPSVIQSAGGAGSVQTIQVVRVANVDEELSSDDSEAKKRREILARRPSYRKILNDLSSPVNKMEDESNSSQSQDGDHESAQNLTSSANSVHYQQVQFLPVVPAGTLQLADGTPVTQGLQTLTVTNSSPTSASSAGGGSTTIVPYAQDPDGQFYIPVGGTNVQAYQIATSLPQGVVMSTTGSPISSPQHISEEGSGKRELSRLLKNREAAREFRRREKEYVRGLENGVEVLENQNKTLIDELKAIRQSLLSKGGFQ